MKLSRRLLFIAYEFPPKGGTQAQHTAKLAVALAQRGWDVTAVSVADPPTAMVDAGLHRSVSAAVRVVPVWSLEPTRIVQSLLEVAARVRGSRRPGLPDASVGVGRDLGTPGGSTTASTTGARGSRGYTPMPRWAIGLVQALFVPDEKIGWTPFVIREALRLHARRPFDVILASGPPFSAYRAAWILSRRLGVPWVADLRDPIVEGYFFKPLTPVNDRLIRRFERRVVRDADRVVVPTAELRDAMLARMQVDSAHYVVAPNGFDPADFADEAPSSGGAFTVSYVGTFQATIRPDTFLAAVSAARNADPVFAADVRVRFVGALDPDTTAALAKTGLADVVERTGFVGHDAAVLAMRRSSVNLLVLGPEPASRGILTSKLPEYLAAGRTVLALVPEGGVAAELVRRAGAGPVVHPKDVAGCTEALLELHVAWRAASLPVPDLAVAAEFNRDRIADDFSALLEASVGAGRSRPPE